jgi:TonB-linked SusC/RagA family outer membrane protein
MMKAIIFIVLATLCLNFRAHGQDKTQKISGTVIDQQGKPMPNVSIRINGLTATLYTDREGRFMLSPPQTSGKLTFSFTGFKPLEVAFDQSNIKNLIVKLEVLENTLEEVNILSTGYQNIPKERATGSFAQPLKEMFEAKVATDVLSKLKGITIGLVFNANTQRSRNGQLDLNIRGRSTIFAGDQPLVVLDNFPYNGDLSNINPNEIENITVLKDAAAASIWGVRAGNGVIVINTKKGSFNQPLKISYNANLTISQKPGLNYNPNQLSAGEYIGLEKFLFQKGYYDTYLNDQTNYPVVSPVLELLSSNRSGALSQSQLQTELDRLSANNVNTEVRDNFYRNAINQQYAINLSAGTKSINYIFSAGYDKNLNELQENSFERITLNSQSTFVPVKNLSFTIGLNIIRAKTKADNTLSQVKSALFPYNSLIDEAGNPLPISYGYRQSYIQSAQANGFLDWSYRPLKELGLQENTTRNMNFRASGSAKYTFLKGFSAEMKYLYQQFNASARNLQGQDSYYVRNLINRFSILTNGKVTGYNFPFGASLALNETKNSTYNLRGQLGYNHRWQSHELAVILGYELSENRTDAASSSFIGYNDDLGTFANVNTTTTYKTNPNGNGIIGNGLGIGGTLDRLRSSFANASYIYKERYSISASARVDGSNYFGVSTNQKNVPLWSAGLKWILDREKFYTSEWFPNLSIRATYGFNGNLDASVTGVTTFRYANNAQYTNLPYAVTSNIGNPDLRWEKSAIANIGIDFASRGGILNGSIEFFNRRGTDVIGFKSFLSSTGISSLKGNYSDMSSDGIDITLSSKPVQKAVTWTTTIQLSYVRDKVTRYDVVPTVAQIVASDGNSSVASPVVGRPVFGLYSYRWGGLNPQSGNPIGFVSGNPSEDYATITSRTPIPDLVYSGAARPVFYGGLNNSIHYKGFSLNIQLLFKAGYYFRKPTVNYSLITSGSSAYLNVNRDITSRWMKPGDEVSTNIPSMVYPFVDNRDYFYQYSEINVERGDHIRLQDISLAYEFTKKRYPGLPFQSLQVFSYINNVGIIWVANRQGLDPDAVPATFDQSTMPMPRTFSFGIKGNF